MGDMSVVAVSDTVAYKQNPPPTSAIKRHCSALRKVVSFLPKAIRFIGSKFEVLIYKNEY